VQNFVSAAVGMTVLAAVIRGFARRDTDRLGNFWVDLTRSLLYILLTSTRPSRSRTRPPSQLRRGAVHPADPTAGWWR
jgi:hypothetical protein